MAHAHAPMVNAVSCVQEESNGFSEAFTDRLLDKLSSDDLFRMKFATDARSALRSLGHETAAADVGVPGRDAALPFLQLKGGLASKERIALGREQFKAVLHERSALAGSNGLAFHQFDFCAG